MYKGIRTRLLFWLALIILPTVAAGVLSLSVIEQRVFERIEADLANTLRLEAARVESELEDYRLDGESLASGPHVKDFVSGVNAWNDGTPVPERLIGGYDGFGLIDPTIDLPLQGLGQALQDKSRSVGAEIAEIRMVSANGRVLSQTSGFTWLEPYEPELVARVISTGQSAFGNAFRTGDGEDRLGLVVPVTDAAETVVGALVLETRLGPVVDLVVAHEGFGESSESHIAQPTPNGDAEFITLARFMRDAAFNVVVPKTKGLPLNRSLITPDGAVVRSPDYRKVESILAIRTLPQTGWGLVVKIDAAEALAPVAEIRKILFIALAITIALALVAWVAYLGPLASRLKRAALAAARVASGDYTYRLADSRGDEIAEMAGSIDRLAADLTADIALRDEAEHRLQHQATHDALTGLHNRKHIVELIEAIERRAPDVTGGILFMDLDRFKEVNDNFGHACGDFVLVEAARRIRLAVGKSGLVARWGGDEFVVVLPRHDSAQARAIAVTIEARFDEPFKTESGLHDIGCSIGFASSGDGVTLSQAVSQADTSMYEVKAKHHHERRVVLDDPETAEAVDIVETALSDDRVEVWFQPIVRTTEDNVVHTVAVEALVRIRTVDGELLAPMDFLPGIRQTSSSLNLDYFVLEHSLESLARWRANAEVDDAFQLFVNLDGQAASDSNLAAMLSSALTRHGLPPTSLVLELSENIVDLDTVILEYVRALGVGIAVDDLGVCCSNLDRLLDAKPDIAKLDRRWLAVADGEATDSVTAQSTNTNMNASTQAVLKSLLQLCEELGTQIVIEGVETGEELALQRPSGHAHLLQGYHFHRPMPESELRKNFVTTTVARQKAA